MLYAIVFACKPPFSILPTSITFYASPSWWSHFCTSAAATLASMGNPTWGISIWPGLCQTHEWFHEISWAFTPWIWIKRRLISFSAAHWNLNKLKIKKKKTASDTRPRIKEMPWYLQVSFDSPSQPTVNSLWLFWLGVAPRSETVTSLESSKKSRVREVFFECNLLCLPTCTYQPTTLSPR